MPVKLSAVRTPLLALVLAFAGLAGLAATEAAASGTVSVAVQGRGDVTGDGINCNESGGPDCSQFYANVRECDPEIGCFFVSPQVELTAGDDRNGYSYSGWSGCDVVDGRVCTTTVTNDRSVTANFADVTDPSVSGLSPASGVQRGTITIGASASDNSGTVSRMEFRVRGALIGTDTAAPYSASFNTAAVSDGLATIRATAFDPSGRSSFTESSVTIDNTAPILSVTSGPDGQTFGPGSIQTWTFSAADATSGLQSVQCSVFPASGSPSFGACSGGNSHTVTNLQEGAYRFTVRATDRGGLETAVTRDFAIDATAPETTITSMPNKQTTRKRARFAFSSSEAGSTFRCSLDGGVWKSCPSPTSFRVSKGRHQLRVRATDAVGNEDSTPASYAWRVLRR